MNKCGIYKKCGSCQLLHLHYEDTIKYKLNKVNEVFKKEKLNIKIDGIIKAKNPFQYRNKMQIGFRIVNNQIIYGFYEENTHKVISLDTCLMHTDLQNKIANGIKEIMQKLRIKPYDEDRRFGLIRYAVIKQAFSTNEVMVVIVTANDIFPGRNNFVKMLRDKFPEITTIIQNTNSRKTSIILGDKERVLFGKGFIIDYLSGLKFKITSKSFYQVNPEQTNKLYDKVFEYAELKGHEIIIDAYSGVGTIGMVLSKGAKQVYCVENNKQAVNAAIVNTKDNNINNVRVIHADATEFIVGLAKDNERIDILVLDPPRTGSTEEFLKAANMLKPNKIIYVSCEPTTLARDLKLLVNNYNVNKCVLVDMFCWTEHVESVVLLERK